MNIDLIRRLKPHLSLVHHLPGRLRLRAGRTLAAAGLAGAGRERAHVATGVGFLAFLLFHVGLNRKRLTL